MSRPTVRTGRRCRRDVTFSSRDAEDCVTFSLPDLAVCPSESGQRFGEHGEAVRQDQGCRGKPGKPWHCSKGWTEDGCRRTRCLRPQAGKLYQGGWTGHEPLVVRGAVSRSANALRRLAPGPAEGSPARICEWPREPASHHTDRPGLRTIPKPGRHWARYGR